MPASLLQREKLRAQLEEVEGKLRDAKADRKEDERDQKKAQVVEQLRRQIPGALRCGPSLLCATCCIAAQHCVTECGKACCLLLVAAAVAWQLAGWAGGGALRESASRACRSAALACVMACMFAVAFGSICAC